MTLSDAYDLQSLMAAIAVDRDRGAFASLFRVMAPRIKAYLRRLGATDEVAEDLVQDVMLTVWRRAVQFDPAKASASTWIFTIARNRRIDVLRRERRPEIDPEDPALVADAPPAADDALEAADMGERLHSAMQGLPEGQLSLLKLAYFEDLSHSQIAERMDLPLGTVKSRLRLATARLKSVLEHIA
ncbi:sigma-70 family RNA polymerase sigma factor [Futiania mangrovi]|uniref:RNA polymerase sigma factor n=1 Tax=Futiania mangrovi TaxID=2959716 RepID=A0A9J6P857_9PROT|nr:sigma-70 family RNA polymerase sigma factor [Futiania mangrovii]MCP1335716.1 sigma-70 family RNA polymerase sigma factor [Futiania mangrovii]